MPVEIRVPALGESIVEATIARWLKAPGDSVSAGDPIVELETDKVNVEVPAEASGTLGEISHKEGDTVGVGEVIGFVSENGAAAPSAPAATTAAPSVPAAPTAVPAAAPATESNGRDTPVTPTASAMASANNVNLSDVLGTLPGGRIGKDDVVRATQPVAPVQKPVSAPSTPTAAPSATPSSAGGGRSEERIKMSRRRQTIAHRLVEAQQTAAMLTTFNEIDMTAVMEVRKRRKESFEKRFGIGLGFTSFFTKAAIGALKAFPYVNGEIQGDEIVLKKYYDIGIAVSADEGLVVPVVRDADRLSFAAIEKQVKELATKARENKLALSDLQGGTFTITNGGIFGSLMSTPILNAPQVGILGLHGIKERAVVVNGEIVIRPMMYVALSYDHRIIDGSTAVRFLVTIKDLIEDPETLLLEG
ncbi:MAG: 2-oxoglutarate dehydrogenase complex dihydrolipoyllysine-residue succinyltransferase [Armatimonadota bacterium]